ncbi:alpha/beta fold hydrolase [Streptosporangium canum]|uniref:alpha/beta fold hydrolase n=1 Tax=Streptosporangium canum TaxID=324952 RepID=UPI003429E593
MIADVVTPDQPAVVALQTPPVPLPVPDAVVFADQRQRPVAGRRSPRRRVVSARSRTAAGTSARRPSGVEDVQAGGIGGSFSADVRRRFDVVGFDPRGVGRSHLIRCRPTTLQPSDVLPTTAEQFRRLRELNRAYGDGCRKLSGPLVGFVDNKSVVRDMDAIRAALGERELTYYGNSYGTLMGQRYAQMFPHRVRAMMLDSTMDHSQATTWMTYDGCGHGVYSMDSGCVTAATERYLIGLRTPARGAHCPAIEPPTDR